MNLTTISALNSEFVDRSDPLMTTLYLGLAGGSEKLYSNIDRLVPGANSCKLHSHSRQEEFFLVLKGCGSIKIWQDGVVEIREIESGYFFCKPAGRGLAHQFINTSSQIMEILDVGSVVEGDEIYYPDEDVTYKKGERVAYKNDQPLKNWSSDANSG